MKILMVQVLTSQIINYSCYSIPHNSKYCIENNYDFYVYQNNEFPYHAAWLKIEVLKKIRIDLYDYIWLLDADAIVNNKKVRIEDIINKNKNHIIVSENGSNGGRKINSGSILIDSQAICILLNKYQAWVADNHSSLYEKYWEQELINDWYESDPNFFSIRPMNEMNSHWKNMPHNNFIYHFMSISPKEREEKLKSYMSNCHLAHRKSLVTSIQI